MTTKTVAPCPNCGGRNLFRSEAVASGGSHGPNFLPRLGSFFSFAKFTVVVCKDCGLTRLFTSPEATAKLGTSEKWSQIR